MQETLAAHKERLRGVAEQAQRDGIEARGTRRAQGARQGCARRAPGRPGRRSGRTRCLSGSGAARPWRRSLPTRRARPTPARGRFARCLVRLERRKRRARRERRRARVRQGGGARAGRRGVREARRARGERSWRKRRSAPPRRAEKPKPPRRRASVLEELEEAKQAASCARRARPRRSERLAQLEVELTEAKALAEEARRRAEADAGAAESARARVTPPSARTARRSWTSSAARCAASGTGAQRRLPRRSPQRPPRRSAWPTSSAATARSSPSSASVSRPRMRVRASALAPGRPGAAAGAPRVRRGHRAASTA